MSDRNVIVTADDLGMSAGVNDGIFRAHDRGIVTSASLVVRRPGAVDAARRARTRPALALGLHLDLGEWEFTGGAWRHRDVVVDADDPRVRQVGGFYGQWGTGEPLPDAITPAALVALLSFRDLAREVPA